MNAAQTHSTDSGWAEVTVAIEGAGAHAVRWTYLHTSARSCEGDCAWLDAVSWTPAEGAEPTVVVVAGAEVPVEWIETAAATILAAEGDAYESAALATAANGVNAVWECYVAGLDPTDEDARFQATITLGADGKPVVSHDPSLSAEEEAKREYRILGAETLDAPEPWNDVTDVLDPDAAGYRFFKVKVRMKE